MENIGNKIFNVCVHDGVFHADEVVALVIIMIALGKDSVGYCRSRNIADFTVANFVVDVGGIYDGVKYFDHHQQDFTKTHENTDIKYASAGLVWDKFCPTIAHKYFVDVDISRINKFYNSVVDNLILGLDAVDNGQYKDNNVIHQNTISSIVKAFNIDSCIDNDVKQLVSFQQVVEFMYLYIDRFLENTVNSILDEDIVITAYRLARDGVMVLPKFIPSWKNIILKVDVEQKIKLCLVQAKPGEWCITSALKEANSMEPLCPAPEFLRGVENSNIPEMDNVKFIFVHKSGYTGSFEVSHMFDALKVAKKWVELSDK